MQLENGAWYATINWIILFISLSINSINAFSKAKISRFESASKILAGKYIFTTMQLESWIVRTGFALFPIQQACMHPVQVF